MLGAAADSGCLAPCGGGAAWLLEPSPRTGWLTHFRWMPAEDEAAVQGRVFESAGGRCQACGASGPREAMKAHPRWDYEPEPRVQKLRDMVCLCPQCEACTLMGNAIMASLSSIQHLCVINAWSEAQARHQIDQALARCDRLSQHRWSLDLRWLLGLADLSAPSRSVIQRFAGAADLQRQIAVLRSNQKEFML